MMLLPEAHQWPSPDALTARMPKKRGRKMKPRPVCARPGCGRPGKYTWSTYCSRQCAATRYTPVQERSEWPVIRDGIATRTLEDIGCELGLSRERVRQLAVAGGLLIRAGKGVHKRERTWRAKLSPVVREAIAEIEKRGGVVVPKETLWTHRGKQIKQRGSLRMFLVNGKTVRVSVSRQRGHLPSPEYPSRYINLRPFYRADLAAVKTLYGWFIVPRSRLGLKTMTVQPRIDHGGAWADYWDAWHLIVDAEG